VLERVYAGTITSASASGAGHKKPEILGVLLYIPSVGTTLLTDWALKIYPAQLTDC
jgi:hypothetical protein